MHIVFIAPFSTLSASKDGEKVSKVKAKSDVSLPSACEHDYSVCPHHINPLPIPTMKHILRIVFICIHTRKGFDSKYYTLVHVSCFIKLFLNGSKVFKICDECECGCVLGDIIRLHRMITKPFLLRSP